MTIRDMLMRFSSYILQILSYLGYIYLASKLFLVFPGFKVVFSHISIIQFKKNWPYGQNYG